MDSLRALGERLPYEFNCEPNVVIFDCRDIAVPSAGSGLNTVRRNRAGDFAASTAVLGVC